VGAIVDKNIAIVANENFVGCHLVRGLHQTPAPWNFVVPKVKEGPVGSHV
jgi:hypothetical protein